MKARLPLAMMGLALVAHRAGASPWSIQPKLGISADYATNPELLEFDGHEETHGAMLVDVPLRYTGDHSAFTLRPSGRLSDSQGYSSLASNYVHLDGNAQFFDELNSLTLQGNWARDSSVYYVGGLANGLGVRRDTAGASADYLRTLTERLSAQFDGSWTTVRYDQPADSAFLTDYRYLTGGPTLIYLLDERTSLKVLGGASQYRSLDDRTESRSYNAQLGLTRALNEIWSVSLTAGYSRSDNAAKIFVGPYDLGTVESRQDGTLYSVALSRQGERLNLTLSARRALTPTGFAYLSRQDSASGDLLYKHSEHWDLGASVSWQRAVNPLTGGGNETVRYVMGQLNGYWHLTPLWTVALHGTRLAQEYGQPRVSGASSGVSVDLTRQFLQTEL